MSCIHSIATGLESRVRKIQEISKTKTVTIHVGLEEQRFLMTSRLDDDNKARTVTTVGDGDIYCVASIFKIFIGVAMALIVDILSESLEPKYQKYRCMQQAWHTTFTDLCKDVGITIGSLEGDPTLLELLGHRKGTGDINHLLFAPVGEALMSDVDFLDVIPYLTRDGDRKPADGKPWTQYSNANYILVALLIQKVAKMSLRDFLKEHIFLPLELDVYMTTEELEDKQLARPHRISSDGVRSSIVFDQIPYLRDTIEFAVCGGHLSAVQLGKFFTALQAGFLERETFCGQKAHPLFSEAFIQPYMSHINPVDDEGSYYSLCGLYTPLHSSGPGSHSLNRAICPDSRHVNDVLGKRLGSEAINAWYMAGSATGWASTAYFIPDKKIFVIVFTDTSSPLDASDLISRLWLHDILQLRPSKLDGGNLTYPVDSSSAQYQDHYVRMAHIMYDENFLMWKKIGTEDTILDIPNIDNSTLCGTFVNGKTHQSLEVREAEGILRVTIKGSPPKESGLMRFVRRDNTFRICSLQTNDSPDLAIDQFVAWRNRDFQLEKNEDGVICLSRKGLDYTDRFVRE